MSGNIRNRSLRIQLRLMRKYSRRLKRKSPRFKAESTTEVTARSPVREAVPLEAAAAERAVPWILSEARKQSRTAGMEAQCRIQKHRMQRLRMEKRRIQKRRMQRLRMEKRWAQKRRMEKCRTQRIRMKKHRKQRFLRQRYRIQERRITDHQKMKRRTMLKSSSSRWRA